MAQKLLYEKGTRKMLVKLTPVLAVIDNFRLKLGRQMPRTSRWLTRRGCLDKRPSKDGTKTPRPPSLSSLRHEKQPLIVVKKVVDEKEQ